MNIPMIVMMLIVLGAVMYVSDRQSAVFKTVLSCV